MMNDKWRSCEFAVSHGLPFVPSLPCGDDAGAPDRVDAFVHEHGLPLVAKPRNGVDSTGVLIVTTRAQAHGAMTRRNYVLQKFLGALDAPRTYLEQVDREGIPLIHSFEGVKRSLQVLIGPEGRIEHVVCTHNSGLRHNARSISSGRRRRVAADRRGMRARIRRCGVARPAQYPVPAGVQRNAVHPRIQRAIHRRHRGALAYRLRRDRHGRPRVHRHADPFLLSLGGSAGGRAGRAHAASGGPWPGARTRRARRMDAPEALTLPSGPALAVDIGRAERREGRVDISTRADADVNLAPGCELPFEDRAVASLHLGQPWRRCPCAN